ncbi:inactive transglutaminase family protein [Dongshaea marina]|uniref:inactive transglutaminase family protein n=1 Tax=Dongshaea marina TaxID=2047966 RepID=UPI000D3E17AB|nr:inactive transglutaminase family protein [Dongshaea marina]
MVSRKPFYILIALLLLAGLALMLYRHFSFDVPWTPGQKRPIWSIEAKVEFKAHGDPVMASLAIPSTQPGFTLLQQTTASPGYGLTFVEKDGSGRAEWSARTATGRQELYYKVDMLADPNAKPTWLATPPSIDKQVEKEPFITAAEQLMTQAHQRSSDSYTLTRELLKELNDPESQNALLLQQGKSKADLIVELLNNADIPARVVKALNLEDGRRRQELVNYIQVFEGDKYQLFNPTNGQQGQPKNLMLWEQSTGSLLDLVGGTASQVTFSMIRQNIPINRALEAKFKDTELMNFSIHTLPIEEQSLFKGILLIPIGVLVVVFLRVIIGLRTSGTFMPVLIALAFIQTSLLTGLLGFLLIVGVGLIIRSYLSKLNLLLVARISAVIIMVILIIALFSVLAYKIGLTEGMKITFFPMIILSWTIERMSILWEEDGPREVVVQGGGSLLVAVFAYLAMNNELIRHLTFNFIGLQLVIMALVLLLGNYTGYRLLELKRFKPMVEER